MGLLSPRPPAGLPPLDPPLVEGTVTVDRRRRLGYAEFGDPDGRLVVWFHGTPGARRQLSGAGRRAAERLGLRVALVERPGIGDSTNHRHECIRDWAYDVAQVADHLGADDFAVVGLSGGGPYALACGAVLADRVRAVGVLGGVVPSVGPDASATGIVTLARTFNSLLHASRGPLGLALFGVVKLAMPFAHDGYRFYAGHSPPGDQAVFADPEIEAMFVDDISHASRRQFQAVLNDAVLFGRDWGFRLADVQVPVRWWHGDADPIVGLEGAQAASAAIPDCELYVRPGESHLGGFAAADEVLSEIDALWDA